MSATLNVSEIERQTQLPIIESQGFSYPVETTYKPTDVSHFNKVSGFVHQSWQETADHILVFCAGLREIRRLEQALPSEIPTLILHGQLHKTPNLMRLEIDKPTVILATNVAESSVTLSRVHTVIDLGLERFAQTHPVTGITELKTRKISKASATQRAGRAGRLGPGKAIRLWSEDQHALLISHQPPELTYADLTGTVLKCMHWGTTNQELTWLDSPSEMRWQLAEEKLKTWVAIDKRNTLTEHGHAMVRIGLEPWLSHFLALAENQNCLQSASVIAAAISLKLLDTVPVMTEINSTQLPRDLTKEANSILQRFQKKLSGTIKPISPSLLIHAFSDRIIYWRNSQTGILVNGNETRAHTPHKEMWGILLDGIKQNGVILASQWLPVSNTDVTAALPPNETITYSVKNRTFRAVSSLGKIKLNEMPIRPTEQQKSASWMLAITEFGSDEFNWNETTLSLKQRWLFAIENDSNWPHWPSNQRWANIASEFMAGISTFDQLPLQAMLDHAMGYENKKLLEQQYPKSWLAPTARHIQLSYDAANAKVTCALKLQEIFGLKNQPTVGNGIPITLSLLSPNGRPVANVTDLSHFWATVYPEIRKELRGRYSKHPWPEDPTAFKATSKTNRQIRSSQSN
jgi:ATP-dependent helicase HrpB